MKCYHHNDADGRCAAALIYNFRAGDKKVIDMIEVSYKDVIDVEAIHKNELIYIVDFSFKPEVMKRVLKKTKNIFWIDHHKTAMEYDYGIDLAGIRSNDASGCELVWRFINGRACEAPMAIQLIGDYDTWTFKHGETSDLFHIGLQNLKHGPKESIWRELFNSKNDWRVEKIIEEGKICQSFRNVFCEDYTTTFGFETLFAGYRCYALNLYKFGSKAFGDKIKKFDICLAFAFDGEQWAIGLYSEKVDVGRLAKDSFQGGGHTGAAGFVCKELPFKKYYTGE